jgi:hypothetical protein
MTMKRTTNLLIFGTIVASSAVTLFLSWSLQGGQCAEFKLPFNWRIALGETCQSSR